MPIARQLRPGRRGSPRGGRAGAIGEAQGAQEVVIAPLPAAQDLEPWRIDLLLAIWPRIARAVAIEIKGPDRGSGLGKSLEIDGIELRRCRDLRHLLVRLCGYTPVAHRHVAVVLVDLSPFDVPVLQFRLVRAGKVRGRDHHAYVAGTGRQELERDRERVLREWDDEITLSGRGDRRRL
jgi:hypothetical protein